MPHLPTIPELLVERRDFVVTATINRPEHKNALNGAVIEGLAAACGHLVEARDVRALVLRGAGGTFCAGGDIKDFGRQLMTAEPAAGEADPLVAMNRRFGSLLEALDALPQVVVTVVEGAAFAGALGLIAVSDVALAASDARFSISETTLGLVPAQIAPFLARKMGSAARRLALTATRFDAAVARDAGLVSDIAAPADLDAYLLRILTDIGRCEPKALAATKAILRHAAPIEPALLDEAAEAFAASLRGAGREGAAAFAAKASPPWVKAL
jgi:isohexenylglutaconyl-CoA hydratase